MPNNKERPRGHTSMRREQRNNKERPRGHTSMRREQRNNKEILNLAVSMGEELLKNGGEIYRVQETVGRVMEAYGVWDYHVFVVTNGIFATVHEQDEDAGSMVRDVPLGDINLEKIAGINQLSREICQGSCSLKEAYKRLEQCKNASPMRDIFLVLACGVESAGFCFLLGGTPFDSIFSFLLGLLLQVFLLAGTKRNVSKFLLNILGSAWVTAGSLVLYGMGLNVQSDRIIIGGIIVLMPGVALVTGIRDSFNGDYLSGGIRLMDALLTGICIAVGVGAAVKVFQLLGGGALSI